VQYVLILISDAFDPSLPGKLRAFGEVTDDKSRLSEAEVVLVRSKTKCDAAYIDSAPDLKLIVRGGVGIDNIDAKYAASRGIAVRNTPKASAITVAELAFALMIAAPTRLIEAHNSMCSGKWEKDSLKRTELFGKHLTLVGIGNIGAELARRAQAFGMFVTAYDPYIEPSRALDLGVNLENDLCSALSRADYISLHTPITDATRGIINRDAVACMKKGAVLINTARAGLIDPEAICEALESGKLGHYCADVWPKDPPAEDYPILKGKNVFMLPHLGGSSKENLLRIGHEVCEILREFGKGGK
jgi:D-3-phosphoglycerate dehydrogenase